MSTINYFKSPNKHYAFKKADCSKKVFDVEKLQYDNQHKLKVVKVGIRNIFEEIQVNKNTNNIRDLIKTTQLTGNTLQYADNSGKVIDAGNLPNDILSTNIAVSKAKKYYDTLDPELTKGLTIDEFVKAFKFGDLKTFISNKISKEDRKEDK